LGTTLPPELAGQETTPFESIKRLVDALRPTAAEHCGFRVPFCGEPSLARKKGEKAIKLPDTSANEIILLPRQCGNSSGQQKKEQQAK
jgi:hypothetical protein